MNERYLSQHELKSAGQIAMCKHSLALMIKKSDIVNSLVFC